MGRKPAARQKIVDASRQIVMERGAGSLTFDEIAEVSGVTRGGITYHFPTKQQLLQALIYQDIAQWQAIEDELRPDGYSDETADLLAYIRMHIHDDQDRRRFVTGMMGAVTLDPPILEPVREYEKERFADVVWTEKMLKQQILRMAAVGLFWSDLFDCPQSPKEIQPKLIELLEQLAVEWSAEDEETPTKKTQDT